MKIKGVIIGFSALKKGTAMKLIYKNTLNADYDGHSC